MKFENEKVKLRL